MNEVDALKLARAIVDEDMEAFIRAGTSKKSREIKSHEAALEKLTAAIKRREPKQ